MSRLRLDRRVGSALDSHVVSVRDVGEGRVLRCAPDSGVMPSFVPGQYTSLGLPLPDGRLLRRVYSIGSNVLADDLGELREPDKDQFYEFYFRRVPPHPKGRDQLTPMLFALAPGDPLHIGTKIVGFHTLERVARTRDILLIATDTGESPHNSLIWQLLDEARDVCVASMILGEPGWRSAYERVHLVLADRYENYSVCFHDYEDAEGFQRRLLNALGDETVARSTLGFSLSSESTHVFLCGDPTMIGAPKKRGGWQLDEATVGAVRALTDHGFEIETRFADGSITFETYW